MLVDLPTVLVLSFSSEEKKAGRKPLVMGRKMVGLVSREWKRVNMLVPFTENTQGVSSTENFFGHSDKPLARCPPLQLTCLLCLLHQSPPLTATSLVFLGLEQSCVTATIFYNARCRQSNI